MKKHLIIISSPSGGGKSTVARYILKNIKSLEFSVSATTRPRRPKEVNGKDYFFMDIDDFKRRIQNNELVEYEEIFDNYYGTLKTVTDKAISEDRFLLFDVDVKGAMSLQKYYPNETLLIFLEPINIEILRQRLNKRNTETSEQIERRINRAIMEIATKDKFDFVILNDNLEKTLNTVRNIIEKNIKEK